jgi:hypothetical protein
MFIIDMRKILRCHSFLARACSSVSWNICLLYRCVEIFWGCLCHNVSSYHYIQTWIKQSKHQKLSCLWAIVYHPDPLTKIWISFEVSFETSIVRWILASGHPIPVHVSPAPVNNAIPDKDKIWLAAKCMQHGKSPSPSATHVSNLLFWHEKCSDIWNELVSLVQDVFDGKAIPQEFLYQRHN